MDTGVVPGRHTTNTVKKRFVVHALDDEDWSPRFLRNRFL